MPTQNNNLRNDIKVRRRALDPNTNQTASIATTARLWKMPELARCKSIGVYLAVNGELNCDKFIKQGWLRQRKIYVPVLRNSDMLFGRLTPKSKLKNNTFGIPEPETATTSLILAAKLDCIITPLIAFDRNGSRLGMGGGFYDKSLRFSLAQKGWRHPLLIGVAFEFQRVQSIQREPWDVPLHSVVTEKTVYRFSR